MFSAYWKIGFVDRIFYNTKNVAERIKAEMIIYRLFLMFFHIRDTVKLSEKHELKNKFKLN